MQPPDSRQQRWVSFDEARMILRMSEGTLRRAIREGKVVAEQRRRSPDSATDLRMVYEVLVTDPPASASPSESVQAPTTSQEPPEATQALVETITGLVERNAVLSDRLTVAEREAGRAELLAEQLAAERARAADLAERLQNAEERARRPWWKRW